MLREMVIFLEIHKDIEERRVRRVSRWAIALRGGRAALASEPGAVGKPGVAPLFHRYFDGRFAGRCQPPAGRGSSCGFSRPITKSPGNPLTVHRIGVGG